MNSVVMLAEGPDKVSNLCVRHSRWYTEVTMMIV